MRGSKPGSAITHQGTGTGGRAPRQKRVVGGRDRRAVPRSRRAREGAHRVRCVTERAQEATPASAQPGRLGQCIGERLPGRTTKRLGQYLAALRQMLDLVRPKRLEAPDEAL